MKQYNHLLVVIEPKRDRQLALERAIEFVRYNPRAQITALRVIYDFSNDIHILNKNNERSTKENVEEETQRQLEEMLRPYQDEDINIHGRIVWGSDIGEAIVKEIREGHHDLLLKGANHHGLFDAILFTPIDWYVLRHAEIPVVIAKEHRWDSTGSIVVAVDFTSHENQAINTALLREAQTISAITKSKIHLVNSAPVMIPTIMLEVPHYAPEIYAENIVKEHKRRLQEFAAMHKVAPEFCHIAEGMPDDVIPDLCRDLNANVVLIGSAGRSGAAAALIGNTCEEIVDYISADLIVLNNLTIKRNA